LRLANAQLAERAQPGSGPPRSELGSARSVELAPGDERT
jgi:hypothetical protein